MTAGHVYKDRVTPSRVCELKSQYLEPISSNVGHTLTGVWVEILKVLFSSPSFLSHPHGCVSWNFIFAASSPERMSHTLTGVWVEMKSRLVSSSISPCHTLTGVWVEILSIAATTSSTGHTLTGVWVEIMAAAAVSVGAEVTPSRVCELKFHSLRHITRFRCVTPSRVCELKLGYELSTYDTVMSHPHGCVSWNLAAFVSVSMPFVTPSRVCELKSTLRRQRLTSRRVTPSRVCELKCWTLVWDRKSSESHPHGCVSWNLSRVNRPSDIIVTPSRVCELKYWVWYQSQYYEHVTPSRVCELKLQRLLV